MRLPLSDGDFIDVKKELNTGEYRDLLSSMALPSVLGGLPRIDSAKIGLAKAVQYLLGWSLIGLDGKPLTYSVDLPENERLSILRSLDTETFKEISDAIDAHEAKQEAEQAARKNGQAGASASSATSRSAA